MEVLYQLSYPGAIRTVAAGAGLGHELVNAQPGPSNALASMRAALSTRRAYIVLVATIAFCTVVGMVLLWPTGDAPKLRFIQGQTPGPAYSAEVSSVSTYACSVSAPEYDPRRVGFETGFRYTMAECQRLTLKLTSGPDQGKTTVVDADNGPGAPRFSVGDQLRVNKNNPSAGSTQGPLYGYSVLDFERKPPLLWLALIFSALVILFGRLRGGLSLIGLAISLLIILVFVVPALLRGSSPLAVALVGSMAVMLTTIPLAHGLGPKSLAAIAGTAASLVLVIGLAIAFTHIAHLTGVATEEAATLAANNRGISFQGLLIAGMVIGSLGVMDDVTISQSSTVMALRGANPQQGFRELNRRAIDVGRDHVSATVNTLVLAYVGSSLTTLLVFGTAQLGFLDAINLEVVASVIVATFVGSIGLICAVPITTALAALLAEGIPADELAAEGQSGHAH